MKRIAIIAGGVVVVLIAGVFIALATVDINQYKGVVQDQVAAATGRTLTIEGELELSVSLSPAIELNGVRFQNASWGSRPDMAVIERVEASVPLLPLIFGNITVNRLALISPDILLERNAQGQANWEFQSEETAADAEAEATALAISAIEIDNATLAFNDTQAGSDVSATLDRLRVNVSGDLLAPDVRRVALDNLTASLTSAGDATEIAVSSLELDAASGGTDVSLDSVVAGQAIAAEGQVGPLGRLVTMDGDFPVKLALNLGGIEFDTDLVADLAAARPNITGSITADTIDLTKLPPTEGTTEKLFPADPIPMDALKAADADIEIDIGRIVLVQALALTDFQSNLSLENGKFSQTQTASMAGGSINSDVAFAAPAGSITIKAVGKGMSSESIAKDMAATDVITDGALDFDVNLKGAGKSVAAMMASLDGSIVGGMGEARIRNDAINLAGADIISQLMSKINPFVAQEEFTVAQCLVVNLQVQDGVAQSEKGIAFVSDRMEITSSGNINLAEEKLSLNIRPKAKEGLGIGMGKLTQIVKLSGPLSNPGIGIDAAGAVKSLGSIAGAFATGGASLLAEGALERGQSSGDTCEAARTWHLAGK
ncbi:MAG: AsmA family protein [Alphaproteobacteria bacterium]|nr:AsmA family protein [Alphaproteobacteria bacterium]